VKLSPVPPNAQSSIPPHLRLLVGEDDAAVMCGVSKPTFRHWVGEGLIAPVKLPHDMRRKLYRRIDLETFAASLASTPDQI